MKKIAMLAVAALMSTGLLAGTPNLHLKKNHKEETAAVKKQKEKKQKHEKHEKRAEKAKPAHKK